MKNMEVLGGKYGGLWCCGFLIVCLREMFARTERENYRVGSVHIARRQDKEAGTAGAGESDAGEAAARFQRQCRARPLSAAAAAAQAGRPTAAGRPLPGRSRSCAAAPSAAARIGRRAVQPASAAPRLRSPAAVSGRRRPDDPASARPSSVVVPSSGRRAGDARGAVRGHDDGVGVQRLAELGVYQ